MKNRPGIAVLLLWTIAIGSTLLVVDDGRVFTILGPVYFVCMLGSLVAVQRAARGGRA